MEPLIFKPNHCTGCIKNCTVRKCPLNCNFGKICEKLYACMSIVCKYLYHENHFVNLILKVNFRVHEDCFSKNILKMACAQKWNA